MIIWENSFFIVILLKLEEVVDKWINVPHPASNEEFPSIYPRTLFCFVEILNIASESPPDAKILLDLLMKIIEIIVIIHKTLIKILMLRKQSNLNSSLDFWKD